MRCAVQLLAALGCGACVVPNMVLPTGPGIATRETLNAPARAELVETAAADGSRLRGVWVPGEPGAPVVLQLMEATVGATEARYTHGLFWDLPGAGYATLAFDYRGVASSGGARSTDHMRADARAMWRAAVERAAGDPARVILRGGSLGALAIATLLQDGARPGAVVLYGPVRSESVVRHFIVTGWAGTPQISESLAPWVALLFRRPLAVDLEREIRRCPAPILVICGARDELLPPEEAERLRAAAAAAGGRFMLEDLGHVELCTRHHRLHQEERAFLGATLPVALDLARRVTAVEQAARAAGEAPLDPAAREWIAGLLGGRVDDPPLAVAGLCSAGFSVERAARWLDANRLARNRWLSGRSAPAVRKLALASEPEDDPIVFALAERVWGMALPPGAAVRAWELRGSAEDPVLQLRCERTADAAILDQEIELPCRDLAADLRARQVPGQGAAQLQELVRVALAWSGGAAETDPSP